MRIPFKLIVSGTIALLLLSVGTLIAPQFHAAKMRYQSVALTPVMTRSYYINPYIDTNGIREDNLYSLGLTDANEQNQALKNMGIQCTKGEFHIYTILDFGQPFENYVSDFSGEQVPYGEAAQDVSTSAEGYANGWYQNSFNCFTLDLVVGVSNEYICGSQAENYNCDYQSGYNLANEVNNLNQLLAGEGDSWQITGKGGIDAEPYSDFGSYASTYDFVYGYSFGLGDNNVAWNLYDFGTAGPSDNSNLGWGTTQSTITPQVYNIAWNIGYDEPFPEDYTGPDSGTPNTISEWNAIGQYNGASGYIQFYTVLLDGTQSSSENHYLWQEFANENAGEITYGTLASSAQQGKYWSGPA